MIDYKSLLERAKAMHERAYVPYSNFHVGAALLCSNGMVYTGCNIENAAYGPTICAERSALCAAVSDGNRDFEAIAVIADTDDYCYPCGVCRQSLFEFNPELIVICGRRDGEYKVTTLHELLPYAFGPVALNNR